jgi:hypothetical protein
MLLIHRPFLCPRTTWTASSSPYLIRYNRLWRESPRVSMASRMGSKPSPGVARKWALSSAVRRMRQGAPGVICSP